MRILVFGSSTAAKSKVWKALDSLHKSARLTFLGTGVGKGADKHAVSWAKRNKVAHEAINPKTPVKNEHGEIVFTSVTWGAEAIMRTQPELILIFDGKNKSAWALEDAKRSGVNTVLIPRC